MSIWLVERGMPLNINTPQNCLTPNFSSINIEFEVEHKEIGKKFIQMFYSFGHNTQ